MHAHRMFHCIRATFAGSLLSASLLCAMETPFTPYKDGHATPSTYSGNSRTLIVREPDSKAWVSHPIGGGAEKGVTKARLQVYVKDVFREGTLRVFLKSAGDRLENQTRYGDIVSADTLGDSVAITMDDVQRMVNIPLGPAFLKGLSDYGGLILEGAEGLDAEFGALEGGHGVLLYLTYGDTDDSTHSHPDLQEQIDRKAPSNHTHPDLAKADHDHPNKANTSSPRFSGPIELGDDNSGGATGRAGIKTATSLAIYSTVAGHTSAGDPAIVFNPRSGAADFQGTLRAERYTDLSDMRLKTDVSRLENPLETILKLRGVSFRLNPDSKGSSEENPRRQIGFIAQEVEEYLPELVHEGQDGYKSLEYNRMTAVLLEAIKEQQAQINALRAIVCSQSKDSLYCK